MKSFIRVTSKKISIIVLITAVVLIGTVLPRIVELVGGTSIAIDRSFFDQVAGPIMLLLVFFMGVCPLLGWAKTSWKSVRRSFLFSFLTTLVVVIIILIVGGGKWYVISAAVCCFPFFVILLEWFQRAKARHHDRKENYFQTSLAILNSNRPRYGGFLVHIGIILITLGIVASSFYSTESTATLDIGQSMEVGEYELTYNELVLKGSQTKVSAVADITVERGGRTVGTVEPSLDFWFSHQDSFAEVAVRTTPAEDLFVSLLWTGFDEDDKAAAFRVLVNPLVVWIWVGGGFFLLGGAVSFSARIKEHPELHGK